MLSSLSFYRSTPTLTIPTCQQDVAELPPRSPDNGRVIEAYEGDDHSAGRQDAQHGQRGWNQGPGGVPLQLDDGGRPATGPVEGWTHVRWTGLTGELVQLELVAVTQLQNRG